MFIYDVEELIQRAKKKYMELKDFKDPETHADFNELNRMLFTDATTDNINTLEAWLEARETED